MELGDQVLVRCFEDRPAVGVFCGSRGEGVQVCGVAEYERAKQEDRPPRHVGVDIIDVFVLDGHLLAQLEQAYTRGAQDVLRQLWESAAALARVAS